MRSDFNKLLCERERIHSRDHYANYRHFRLFTQPREGEEFADLPSRESMKARFNHRYTLKNFNENLNPLYNFIRCNVGRKWDKVYSEICKTFDKRSVINQHILIHLFQLVETNCRVLNDKVVFLQPYRNSEGWVGIERSYSDYYVDPRDGILHRNTKKLTARQQRKLDDKHNEIEEQKVHRIISDKIELFLIDGIWYEAMMEKCPPPTMVPKLIYSPGSVVTTRTVEENPHFNTVKPTTVATPMEVMEKKYHYCRDVITRETVYNDGSKWLRTRRYSQNKHRDKDYYDRAFRGSSDRALTYAVSKRTLNKKDKKKYGLNK